MVSSLHRHSLCSNRTIVVDLPGREKLAERLVCSFLLPRHSIITTVERDSSDETEINFTIVVINLWMRKVFENLINVE